MKICVDVIRLVLEVSNRMQMCGLALEVPNKVDVLELPKFGYDCDFMFLQALAMKHAWGWGWCVEVWNKEQKCVDAIDIVLDLPHKNNVDVIVLNPLFRQRLEPNP